MEKLKGLKEFVWPPCCLKVFGISVVDKPPDCGILLLTKTIIMMSVGLEE